MSLIHKKILGVNITFSQKVIILEEIEKYLQKIKNQRSKIKDKIIKPLVIFTPNPEIINYAGKDIKFKEVVTTAQISLPDSSGIVWAVKKIHGIKIEKISGSDFVWDLAKMAAKRGVTIGLIGGRNGVALDVRECLRKKYSALKVEVLGEPEIKFPISNFQFSNNQIAKDTVKKIIKSDIRILFVALGHPKQEYFISEIKDQRSKIKNSEPLILMSVGGSFDYISGRIPRAPLLMRNLGLEWLFRLIREPQRLGRQIKGAEFFWRILTS